MEQPIVVQNRTGGGWTVAANHVLGLPGNENLLFGIVPTVFATPIVQNLDNTYEKVTPLAMLARMDLLVVARADLPMNSLADFVEAAKKGDRVVSMAGANVGSTDHIVSALIEKAAGVTINYVPFDGGGGPILSAFLGGTVDAITLPPDEAMPLLKGGQAKAIAVLSNERRPEPELKDVPTAKEAGYDVVWGSDHGIAGPPDLDPAVAAWWQDKISKMVQTAAWDDDDEGELPAQRAGRRGGRQAHDGRDLQPLPDGAARRRARQEIAETGGPAMRKLETASAIVLLALAALVALGTSGLPYWADFAPGPAFAAWWVAGAGALIAVLLLLRHGGARRRNPADWPERGGLVSILLAIGAMWLFVALLPVLGTTASGTILMLVLLLLVERRPVLPSLATTIVTVALVELVFNLWLDIDLPKGLLGF